MTYIEIVEELRKNKTISTKDINGKQAMMLLQDREIKQIKFNKITYEINFIPITYVFEPIEITDSLSFDEFSKIIEHFVNCYKYEKTVYIHMDEEYFEIKLEILETENE